MEKRVAITLVAIFVLSLGLFGCGSSASTSSEAANDNNTLSTGGDTNSSWITEVTTDEFGDITSDSTTVLKSEVAGTFSNTATSGSDFTGTLTIRWMQAKNDEEGATNLSVENGEVGAYVATFDFELYGNNPFSYIESKSADGLKTKSSLGEKRAYQLTGLPPDGELILLDNNETFVKDLQSGGPVECVISYENTTFNFTVDTEGFDAEFSEYDKSIKDAIAEKIDERTTHNLEEAVTKIKDHYGKDSAALYLSEHVDEFQVLKQTELESLFPGTYAQLTANRQYASGGAVYGFESDGTVKQLALVDLDRTLKDTTSSNIVKDYSVESGKLSFMGETFEVRKAADDFYVLVDGDGDMQYVMYPQDYK